MKTLKKENERISTFLIFALIPISGFAIDVYIPSFPAMAKELQVTSAAIKLTLIAYTVSYGFSQLLLGSIIDSYGRYRTNLIALLVFILCNLGIIFTGSLTFIVLMRVIQGIAISLVLMSRRAFLIDVYIGEKRMRYMSLLSVVWSTAPIIAPFAGGYLQDYFGWRSNFIFLIVYGSIVLVLELLYGGETIKEKMKFNWKNILQAYKIMFRAGDFTLGMLLLGFCYGMVIVFCFSIPFIVEHGFHLTPVVTGYCALCSGVAILFGGLIARKFTKKTIISKLLLGTAGSFGLAFLMFLTAELYYTMFTIMIFVVLIHAFQGFNYNVYFTYCVTRFPQYAGTCSGVVSGGSYIVLSFSTFIVPRIINITDQKTLSYSYLLYIGLMAVILWFIGRILKKLEVR
jgi:MFS family permease